MRFFLILSFSSTFLFATVALRMNPRVVQHGQSRQIAGLIQFCIDGDDFFEATPMDPVYIRLRLSHGVVLSETLVDIQSGSHDSNPIYLAMRIVSASNYTIAAPEDTLSIVRWREGEDQIWLRVNLSSSEWVQADALKQAPDAANFVCFELGLDAQISHTLNEALLAVQKANRQANSREDAANPVDLQFVSTLLCVDLSNSSSQPFPSPDYRVFMEPDAFVGSIGVTSEINVENIQEGFFSSANFSGDSSPIHVFEDQTCAVNSVETLKGLAFCNLPEITLHGRIGLQQDCHVPWYQGNEIELNLPPSSSFGFKVGTPITSPHGQPGFTVEGLGFGNPVPFPGVAYGLDADGTYMSSQGTLLCKRVYLFSDQDYADSSFPTEINLDLLTEPCVQNDEAWVEITVTTALTPFPFVGSGPYAGSQGGCPQLLANHSPFSQLAGQVSPYFFGQLAGWPEDPDLLQLTLWVNQLGTIQ